MSVSLPDLAGWYWATVSEYSPTTATVRGVHDFDHMLRKFDGSWLEEMRGRFAGISAAAADLTTTTLQDRISARLLEHEAKMWATEIDDRMFVAPVDPYLGPHTRLISDTRQNTVGHPSEAAALLDRYRSVPDYLSDALDYQRRLAEDGMPPAAPSLQRVIDQLDGYLATGLDDDPFLSLELPTGVHRDGWYMRANTLVTDTIRPALADYRDGLVTHLGPVARGEDKVGLIWVENGDAIYEHLIERYTQLARSPRDIHDIGEQWATELLVEEWAEIGGRALGVETLPEIFGRLHNDPSMRFESETEMLEHARDAIARAWAAVDDWFDLRPDTPCEVVPVPTSIASAMPPAYYMQPPLDGSRDGTYFLNTYRPEERDRFEAESTHFHEAVPGHHFDRSLATELEGIPTFRRYSQVYAHTEGWGLYSERLADEMGLFSSDIDRLGLLSADAWRAGRLVVDTGMHALGWSRQQAIDWLGKWTPIGQLTIEQETDRYIGMAGQALSYKMGQLHIMGLRARAETRLGEAFDIKQFHNVCLASGAMTLPLLEELVEDWIESVQAGPT